MNTRYLYDSYRQLSYISVESVQSVRRLIAGQKVMNAFVNDVPLIIRCIVAQNVILKMTF